jgi:exosortase A-associated hydrolase 2
MPEIPFFFPNRGYDLFGVLHEGSDSQVHMPFVLCHPFVEEKLWSHRVYVSLARELARRGHPVLRFDYMGNGDSDGDFAESSVTSGLSDVGRAVDTLRSRTGADRVGLLGLRFGATLAAQVAERRDDIGALVLWSPIVDGQRYIQELLRINLTTQMTAYREIRTDRDALVADMRAGKTANVDGYEISLVMFEEMSAVRLLEAHRRFTGPCLIVDIVKSPKVAAAAELKSLAQRYVSPTLLVAQEDFFWKEIERFYDAAPNLFGVTLDWMANQFPEPAASRA